MLTLQHSPTNNSMLVVAEWAVPKASMSTTTQRTKILSFKLLPVHSGGKCDVIGPKKHVPAWEQKLQKCQTNCTKGIHIICGLSDKKIFGP